MDDWLRKHLGQLIGGTIEGITTDNTEDEDEFYGLVIRVPDRSHKTAWVLRDPEGNGPGHLEIDHMATTADYRILIPDPGDGWIDIGEGPWKTLEDAVAFGKAEVPSCWLVVHGDKPVSMHSHWD